MPTQTEIEALPDSQFNPQRDALNASVVNQGGGDLIEQPPVGYTAKRNRLIKRAAEIEAEAALYNAEDEYRNGDPSEITNLTWHSGDTTTTSVRVSWDELARFEQGQYSIDGLHYHNTGHASEHTITGLSAQEAQTIYVRCRRRRHSDPQSVATYTAPEMPTGVTASATGAAATVSWTIVSGLRYQVERSSDEGNWILVDSGDSSYEFTGLANGAHLLKVRAVWNGVFSEPEGASVTISAGNAPAAPSGLTLTGVFGNFLIFTWTVVADVTYQWSFDNMTYTNVGANGNESVDISSLASGQHTLYLRAVDSDNTPSDPASFEFTKP